MDKLSKKANAKEEMLSKESELMTLQSNLDLQSKDLDKEKSSL